MAQFNESVGERHKAYDALLKLFKKKIKRTRKPTTEDAEEYDSEEEVYIFIYFYIYI